MSELEFGADMVLARVTGETDREATAFEFLASPVANKDIVTDDPLAIGCSDVCESPGLCRVGHHFQQGAAAAVVVLGVVEIDDTLALHVGLSGQYEHLQFLGARIPGVGDVDEKAE